MSLLTIVQNTCDLMSITRPVTVVNSTDQQVRQLYALANEEGQALANAFDWQIMRREQTFVTVAQADQTAALPDDIDHFINNSFFNRSTRRRLIGPITPQQYQAILAQPQLNRVYLAFIERDGQFLITPEAPAGQTIAYEYQSTNWAKSAGGVPQSSFIADTDETYLPEYLIKLGLRWRWQSAKGLDYAETMSTYEREKQRLTARDGGNTILNTTGSDTFILSNLPEGNYPGPGGP